MTFTGSCDMHPENVVKRDPDRSRLRLAAMWLALGISGPVDVVPGLGHLRRLEVYGVLGTAP